LISLNILCVLELALEKDLDFWDLDSLKMVSEVKIEYLKPIIVFRSIFKTFKRTNNLHIEVLKW
jgi:hypothetical protein